MYRFSPVLAAFLVIWALHPSPTSASQIYTWQDEDGTTHFSDQPHTGAAVLDIQLPAPPAPLPMGNATTSADSSFIDDQPSPEDQLSNGPALPEPSIQIDNPTNQQTLRDNQGNLTITASANRKLNQGHNVQLRLDGEVYGRPQSQLSWPLTNIDRGSHTLQVELLKHGKVIASSEEITVFLHRARINQRPAPLPVPK